MTHTFKSFRNTTDHFMREALGGLVAAHTFVTDGTYELRFNVEGGIGTGLEDVDGKETAKINMTLTSPACPLTDVIGEQVEAAVVGNKLADAVQINWVWMPPWGPNMITEEGREMLQALGFAV